MATTAKRNNAIVNFFRQTFRRHTGEEYSELLTRGMHGEKGVNRKYPWAYIRLFSLALVLFAVFLLIVRFTFNELFTPAIVVIASCTFNIPILLFLYELYPERDLSFLWVCLAATLGGAASNVMAQILFDIFTPSNEYVKAVFSGVFEELSKAAATLIIIIITRKSSPMAGFVLGAAVGCGFSIVEDMGYMFVSSNEMFSINLSTVIELAFSRGLSSCCTHILWTAAVGWAFCRSEKYLSNLSIYPILLISIGLHTAWDLPLSSAALAFVYAGCVVVVETECLLIIHFERKKVFSAAEVVEYSVQDSGMRSNADVDTLDKTDPQYWTHWGRFTVVLGCVLMSVIAVIYCHIPFMESYGSQTFETAESFISYMQNGVTLDTNTEREHDGAVADTPSGEYVFQSVSGGSVTMDGVEYAVEYRYWYSPVKLNGGYRYFFYKLNVSLTDPSGESKDRDLETIYNSGVKFASFYRFTEDNITGYNFNSDGSITLFVYDADYVRDLTDVKYLWLFCTFAAIFSASLVVYIALKIKGAEVKKLCSVAVGEGGADIGGDNDNNDENNNNENINGDE